MVQDFLHAPEVGGLEFIMRKRDIGSSPSANSRTPLYSDDTVDGGNLSPPCAASKLGIQVLWASGILRGARLRSRAGANAIDFGP